jgi:DNA-directed RNA polymerase subunit RPC12/RpoP
MTPHTNKNQSSMAQQDALLSEASVAVFCPSCGHRMRRKIARLQTEPDVVCRDCGATVLININAGEFREAIHKQLNRRRH